MEPEQHLKSWALEMKPQMRKETLALKPVVLKKVVLAPKKGINTEKSCTEN